jgi:adenylate cyclase class IV
MAGAPAAPGAADEVELKAAVPDPAALRARLEAAGARLVFAGRLEDRRYDTPTGALARRDEVLRVRVAVARPGGPGVSAATVDWKGPTRHEGGYKVREERSTTVGDAAVTALVLGRLGLVVARAIDREVEQYAIDTADGGGATVRLEHYPRMDVLAEVEGTPAAIEHAIAATGLPRSAFSTARLSEFALAYERRTGLAAAVCRAQLGAGADA